MLGLVLVGMMLGAISACGWIMAGGSLLVAVVLHALVGSLFVLGAGLVAFLLSERHESGDARLA